VRRLLAVVLALAATGIAATGASADGDPASDTLLIQQLYTPVAQKISPPVLNELSSTVTAANQAGFKIRVALILDKTDLGAVPQLFGHPVQYVHLLASELVYGWKGGVIAVQPSGIGVRNVTPLAKAQALVDTVKVATPASADGLAEAAITAVRKLATEQGKTLPAVSTTATTTGSSGGSGGSSVWTYVEIAVPIVVLLAAIGVVVVRLRARSERRA
jgi:hypothetical protein